MRTRRLVVLALLAAVAATTPAHAAGPTLDGKAKRSHSFSIPVSDPQQHVLAETAGNDVPMTPDPEVTDRCEKPRCFAVPFRIAKGSRRSTTVSVHISWTLPVSRFWLDLVDLSQPGAPAVQAECYSYYVSTAQAMTISVEVPAGRQYAAWVLAEQVVAPDTVTGVIKVPGTDTHAANPAAADPTGAFAQPCQG